MICRDCPDVTTTGLTVCHCAACHETFGSVSGFDAHRTGPWSARRCLPPGDVRKGRNRLVLADGHVWKWDDPDGDGLSRRRGGNLSAETTFGVLTPTPGPEDAP